MNKQICGILVVSCILIVIALGFTITFVSLATRDVASFDLIVHNGDHIRLGSSMHVAAIFSYDVDSLFVWVDIYRSCILERPLQTGVERITAWAHVYEEAFKADRISDGVGYSFYLSVDFSKLTTPYGYSVEGAPQVWHFIEWCDNDFVISFSPFAPQGLSSNGIVGWLDSVVFTVTYDPGWHPRLVESEFLVSQQIPIQPPLPHLFIIYTSWQSTPLPASSSAPSSPTNTLSTTDDTPILIYNGQEGVDLSPFLAITGTLLFVASGIVIVYFLMRRKKK
jgi:hypothetical protein